MGWIWRICMIHWVLGAVVYPAGVWKVFNLRVMKKVRDASVPATVLVYAHHFAPSFAIARGTKAAKRSNFFFCTDFWSIVHHFIYLKPNERKLLLRSFIFIFATLSILALLRRPLALFAFPISYVDSKIAQSSEQIAAEGICIRDVFAELTKLHRGKRGWRRGG